MLSACDRKSNGTTQTIIYAPAKQCVKNDFLILAVTAILHHYILVSWNYFAIIKLLLEVFVNCICCPIIDVQIFVDEFDNRVSVFIAAKTLKHQPSETTNLKRKIKTERKHLADP